MLFFVCVFWLFLLIFVSLVCVKDSSNSVVEELRQMIVCVVFIHPSHIGTFLSEDLGLVNLIEHSD